MFRDTVTYKDYNNVERTDTLWFNISQTDVMADIAMIDRVAAVERMLKGEPRELNTAEKQQVLDMVQEFMKLGYGVKSDDGRHFRKTDEVWDDFRWSNAYDAYLMKLFTDPELAAAFGTNVLPQDLREKAVEARKLKESSEYETPDAITSEPEDTRPQWLKDGRVPTDQELVGASKEHILEAIRMKNPL